MVVCYSYFIPQNIHLLDIRFRKRREIASDCQLVVTVVPVFDVVIVVAVAVSGEREIGLREKGGKKEYYTESVLIGREV